jgi:carbonic anhydrase
MRSALERRGAWHVDGQTLVVPQHQPRMSELWSRRRNMMMGYRLVVALSAATLAVGCGGAEDATGDPPLETAPHWSYEDGEHGPESWGDLHSEFATCSTGTQQSPIDIPSHISPGDFGTLTFDYGPAPATLIDNGHTIQVNLMEGASQLDVDGDTYSLLQFHFHAHSEHAVDGVHMPLELHLVHRSESGALAVIGVFLDLGTDNSALSPVFDAIEDATANPSALTVELDPADLLPGARQGWAYSGSLTTPPCTEGVNWHVMSTPIHISEAQLAAFTTRHDTNRRPIKSNAGTVTSGSSRRLP